MDARSKSALLRLGAGDGCVHGVKQLQTSAARLLESLPHNLRGDAHDLDVHLEGGDALARAGHLEVHVAVVVFGTGDVGQDSVLLALFHQAHGDARDCALERDAGLHEGERCPADRSHRRGSVRLEDVRDHPQRVRRLIFSRQHGLDRAPGQSSVADLTPAHTGHAADLAHRKGREVVVEHKAPLLLALIAFHALRVVGRAQRGRDQRLRLAAGE